MSEQKQLPKPEKPMLNMRTYYGLPEALTDKSDVEILRDLGGSVGSILVSDFDMLRITAIGESRILGKMLESDGEKNPEAKEHSWSLRYNAWKILEDPEEVEMEKDQPEIERNCED
jgi:hypothetical protein